MKNNILVGKDFPSMELNFKVLINFSLPDHWTLSSQVENQAVGVRNCSAVYTIAVRRESLYWILSKETQLIIIEAKLHRQWYRVQN